jgi:hypothetical protein
MLVVTVLAASAAATPPERGVLLALSRMTGNPSAKVKRIGTIHATVQFQRRPLRVKATKRRVGVKAYKKWGVERKARKKAPEPERPQRPRVNSALRKSFVATPGKDYSRAT